MSTRWCTKDGPVCVRLHVARLIGGAWAAMILADGEPTPRPGRQSGISFPAATAEEAEGDAIAYLLAEGFQPTGDEAAGEGAADPRRRMVGM